jgi:phage terminase small subunit
MAAPRQRRNDAKLEAFAQAMAKGKSAVEAAREAGYGGSSMASNAKRRAQMPAIRARVAELRQLAASKTVVTVERLISNSEEARLLAMSLEEPSAANQCIQTMAKLSGLWRDKVALTDPSGEKPYEGFSDADRAAAVATLMKKVKDAVGRQPVGEGSS